ncbi:epsilon-sarcoglycan-like isoform X4 [Branchiostoma floridae]|uniref:Epsilon-sarcoglycan-like isoform X4 n=1 Tax=Branchiostoma floridae TaxID=7739 RepID=A0A9J7K8S5_BRAFL|nr:epsilon-sarcoglycan-like isoform X4 [Branchiostoma floridae]
MLKSGFAVLSGLLLVFLVPDALGNTYPARVGLNFMYRLDRETYTAILKPDNTGAVDPIVYTPTLKGHPGLPDWLHFIQRNSTTDGYMYGTPTKEDLGPVNIEIVAFNKNTFETNITTLTINVEDNDPLPFQVQFMVENKNVEEFFHGDTRTRFLRDVRRVWQQNRGDLYITKVVSALDMGHRNPLPLPELYEGVYIHVGSERGYSAQLQQAAGQVAVCELNPGIRPVVSIDSSIRNFDMNWCMFKLFEPEETATPAPLAPGAGVMGGVYVPRELTDTGRDFTLYFILIIIIPCIILIVLLLLLTYIMCGRRQGVQKRDQATPAIQLTHHASIREASKELRDLSQKRDIKPRSTLPMFNAASPHRGDEGTPLTRAPQEPADETPRAPPPYRLPPDFPNQEESSFINSPPRDNSRGNVSQPGGSSNASPSLQRRPPPFMRSGEQIQGRNQPGDRGRPVVREFTA